MHLYLYLDGRHAEILTALTKYWSLRIAGTRIASPSDRANRLQIHRAVNRLLPFLSSRAACHLEAPDFACNQSGRRCVSANTGQRGNAERTGSLRGLNRGFVPRLT